MRLRPLRSVTWALGVTACGASSAHDDTSTAAVPAAAPVSADPNQVQRHVPPVVTNPSSASPAALSGTAPGAGEPPMAPGPEAGADGDPSVTQTPDDIIMDDELLEASPEPALADCSEGVAGTEETRELMQPFAFERDSFVPRTIYSWTVPEQIDELRADPTLLTRSMSSNGERGRAADLMLETAESDEFSALLSEARFEKRRFGWANPWATVMGFTGEGYGDRLLAITLKEEAIVGRMVATSLGQLEWSFQTLTGETLDRETVLANSDRLAAIYFIDERDPATCHGSFTNLGSVMREFFVLNETMIESWSAFTPELQAEVARGIDALSTLESALMGRACFEPEATDALSPTCWREKVLGVWGDPTLATSSLLGLYELSLAFPNDLYLPTRDNLRRLIETLELVPFEEETLTHTAGAVDETETP